MCVCVYLCRHTYLFIHAMVHLHISDNNLQVSVTSFPMWVLRIELKSAVLLVHKSVFLRDKKNICMTKCI